MNRFIWLALFLGSYSTGAVAQPLTIPQRVARGDSQPVHLERISEILDLPFDALAREADTIVYGTVTALRTYLSDDQREVLTDYEVTPIQVVAQRVVKPSPTPGPQPIVITQWGGQLTIDGVQVTAEDHNLPMLPAGVPLVLFLTSSAKGGRHAGDDIMKAFAVDGVRMRPLSKPPLALERFKGVELGQFLKEVNLARQIASPVR